MLPLPLHFYWDIHLKGVLGHKNSSVVPTVSPGSCSVAGLEKGIGYYHA